MIGKTSEYLSIRDLAARTGFGADTVRKLIRAHAIPHYRSGPSSKILIRWSDWEAFLETLRVEVKRMPVVEGILREFAGSRR